MRNKISFYNIFFFTITCSIGGATYGFYKNIYDEYLFHGISIIFLQKILSDDLIQKSTNYGLYGASIGTLLYFLFGEKT